MPAPGPDWDWTAIAATVSLCAGACGATPANSDPDDIASCTPPGEWTCDPARYADGDGCHCGCGALDPDCAGLTLEYCNCTDCSDAGACDPGARAGSTLLEAEPTACGIEGWRCVDSCNATPCGSWASAVDPATNWLCIGTS